MLKVLGIILLHQLAKNIENKNSLGVIIFYRWLSFQTESVNVASWIFAEAMPVPLSLCVFVKNLPIAPVVLFMYFHLYLLYCQLQFFFF